MKKLYIAPMMKKIVSLLLMLSMILSLQLCQLSPASAEDTVRVRFTVQLNENVMFAKFGVMVYLDGKPIEFLQQGDRVTFTAALNGAAHEIKIAGGQVGVKPRVLSLGALEDGSRVSCTLQTHMDYIELTEYHVYSASGQERVGSPAPASAIAPAFILTEIVVNRQR